jgi:methenyltetrahydromethanopterin cyclohydrolase
MLAVAALSARSLVDAAALDGLRTVALDVFGDADTLRASSQWLSIGEPAAVRIDAERLLQALHTLARRGDVQGWIAGSGFDGRPELLERGAALLPLIGTLPAELRRLRDPREFFAALDLHGIVHPPVRFEAPSSSDGWLTKDFAACGGWHVCRAAAGPTDVTGRHWQRERPGVPMSATFVANGRDAVLLGFNRQSVQAIGDRPFVFAGVIGPVPVDGAVRRAITRATRALAAAFGLRGLGSIDFLLDGDAASARAGQPVAVPARGIGRAAARSSACLPRGRAAGRAVDGCGRAWPHDRVRVPAAAARCRRRRDDRRMARGARSAARRCAVRDGSPRLQPEHAGPRCRAGGCRSLRAPRCAAEHPGVPFMSMSDRPAALAECRLSLNEHVEPWVERLRTDTEALRVKVTRDATGACIVDAGIEAPGSIAAGLLVGEICLGGFGTVGLRSGAADGWPSWIEVRSSQPVLACLASQYAGWSLAASKEETGGKKFFSLGSGPARALAAKEPLYAELGYRDLAELGVLVLEVDRAPPEVVIRKILRDCNLRPDALTLVLTPTSSAAGTTQVVARVLEVALHKTHELGFALGDVVDGVATAPLPAPSPDGVEAMGRTNDAIL